MTVRLDHIAIAVPRIADVTPFLVGVLGGEPAYGARSRFFSFGQWRFEGGGRLEILEPRGDDGFLHRFLAERGPGVHHVTFRVPDLRAACTRAEAAGYKIVGYDDSDPYWKEAFLHPKQALGIVVQLAQLSPGADGAAPAAWPLPPAPPRRLPAVTLVGLRAKARSRERAELQWGQLLDGTSTPGDDGELIYRWERSPLRIVVEVDPATEEGPTVLEIASRRAVELPAGPHPILGATFVRRDREAEARS